MKTGFSLWEKLHRENPVFITGNGFAVMAKCQNPVQARLVANVKITSQPVPSQDFELVLLSLCCRTMKKLLSFCPARQDCIRQSASSQYKQIRRRLLFFKIKVRPRSCRSYPIWRPCKSLHETQIRTLADWNVRIKSISTHSAPPHPKQVLT